MPPAARIGDMHTCPMQTPGTPPIPHVGGPIAAGCPTVLICGVPAARLGDMAVCVGPPDTIAKGSATVLIGGMPAARMGDNTAHGGVIVVGAPMVLIGDAGSAAMGMAKAGAAPFCKECAKATADAAAKDAKKKAAVSGASAGSATGAQGKPKQNGAVRGAKAGVYEKKDSVPRNLAKWALCSASDIGKGLMSLTKGLSREGAKSGAKAGAKGGLKTAAKGALKGAATGIAIGTAFDTVESAVRNRAVWKQSKADFVGRVGYAMMRAVGSNATDAAAGAVAGAVIGGIIGSVVPGAGTAAGAIIGAKVGMFVGPLLPGFNTIGEKTTGKAIDKAAGGDSQGQAEAAAGQRFRKFCGKIGGLFVPKNQRGQPGGR